MISRVVVLSCCLWDKWQGRCSRGSRCRCRSRSRGVAGFEIGARKTRSAPVGDGTTMEDQRPTGETLIDRRHLHISKLFRPFSARDQFPEFLGLVPNFATRLIVLATRIVRIGCCHVSRFRAVIGKGLWLRT